MSHHDNDYVKLFTAVEYYVRQEKAVKKYGGLMGKIRTDEDYDEWIENISQWVVEGLEANVKWDYLYYEYITDHPFMEKALEDAGLTEDEAFYRPHETITRLMVNEIERRFTAFDWLWPYKQSNGSISCEGWRYS